MEEVLPDPPAWLLPVLVPLAGLYAAGVTLHRSLYSVGILRSRDLPRTVVSVGNVTAGGGGKTPLVIWLAQTLSKVGIRPAVLSRGYGREGKGIGIVDPDGPWRIFGDEPSMMAVKLGDIPVVVSADRYRAGLELLKDRDVDLFILDDGFQHHALKRDVDVVTVDSRRRFGTGRLLPAGILREPVKRLQDADFIVLTKADEPDYGFEQYLSRLCSGPVYRADYRPVGLVPVRGSRPDTAGTHSEGPFTAFCGIADPESFRASLHRMGLMIGDLMVFPDHHPYSEADMARISGSAKRAGAKALVTTEKDAVRLPRSGLELPCYAAAMEAVLPDDSSLLIERVMELVHGEGSRI